ncbi:MAG: ATP-binding protein [Candidatus Thorarchaeota archaeon]
MNILKGDPSSDSIENGNMISSDPKSSENAVLGEVISGAVSGAIELKLKEDSEEVRIGYPVVVEGKKFDFYCMLSDICFPGSNAVTMLANAERLRSTIPSSMIETARGRTFFSTAMLQCLLMIEKTSGKTYQFETLPPYFSSGRLANEEDVNQVYIADRPELHQTIGTLRGVPKFEIPIDFKTLIEVPFGIFGRTHSGKTFLNKIILGNILFTGVSQVLVFDMQSEYGWRSRADRSPGLKFFFEDQVTLIRLDPVATRVGDADLLIGEDEITSDDLLVVFQDLSPSMVDAIFEIDSKRAGNQSLVDAIRSAPLLEENPYSSTVNTLNALARRMGRLNRLEFVVESGRGTLNNLIGYIKSNQSIVIDFGKYGGDHFAYVFVANIISRRLYNLYSRSDEASDLPHLVVLLEEAHKFLEPSVARYTIFDRLAREMRKFNLVLAMVDQRPSKIDTEILSQLANRFVLSLTDPKDIVGALTGPVDPAAWKAIVKAMPVRTVLMFGDAIKAPTAMDVLDYNELSMSTKWKVEGSSREDFRKKLEGMSEEQMEHFFDP